MDFFRGLACPGNVATYYSTGECPAPSSLNSNLEYSFASTGWSNPTYKITKNNRIVDINYHCIVSGGIAAYKYYVATLPEDVRPSTTRNSVGWVANNGVRYAASVEINKNGTISLVAGGSFEEAGFAATFIV